MKKVLMGHDEQVSINTSNSSVPSSSITESNEMIIMDIDSSNGASYPVLDDDDSRSVDFVSDAHLAYPSDEISLNSSQSSLQHPMPTPLNSLLISRQISTTSQPLPNHGAGHSSRRFSAIDMRHENQLSFMQPLPPLKISVDEASLSLRNDVSRVHAKDSVASRRMFPCAVSINTDRHLSP